METYQGKFMHRMDNISMPNLKTEYELFDKFLKERSEK